MRLITTSAAARRQYAKNLETLRAMLRDAEACAPKKHRGYTVQELRQSVEQYDALASGRAVPIIMGRMGR